MTTLSKKRSRGIPAWEAKMKIVRQLLNGYTDTELVAKVFPPKSPNAWRTASVIDMLRKWHTNVPRKADGPRVFFDELAKKLGCRPDVTGVMLVEASLAEFIQMLPDGQRDLARLIAGQPDAATAAQPASAGAALPFDAQRIPTSWKTVLLYHRGAFESVGAGVKAGKVDTRHLYLTPDAADVWSTLVRAEQYPTYDQCKAGLRALFESTPWLDALLAAGSPTTAVMLGGGGAPTKDLVLLRSLLAQERVADQPINYYLVDISFYMLYSSMQWLESSVSALDGHERIELNLVCGDILDLAGCRPLFRGRGNVVFALTGGTIGNLSERAFFHSLDRVADHGDLLVLSADTLDGLDAADVEAHLKHKYDHEDMRRFITPVVRDVIRECQLEESLATALRRVNVRLRSGVTSNLSDVPGSWSVDMTLRARDRDVTVLSSTRYRSEELVAFVTRFGWELVCRTPSPSNPQFVQFCFRRNAPERAGKS